MKAIVRSVPRNAQDSLLDLVVYVGGQSISVRAALAESDIPTLDDVVVDRNGDAIAYATKPNGHVLQTMGHSPADAVERLGTLAWRSLHA